MAESLPLLGSVSGGPRARLPADIPAATAETEPDSFVAIGILIPQAGDDGELQLVPAWYVPEQIEEIDIHNLTPAERIAVLQLLGPDYEFSGDVTI